MKFKDIKITEYGPHSRYAKVGNTTMRANTRTGKVSANTKVGDHLDLYVDNTLNKDGSQGRGTATYTKDKLKIKHDTRKGASASYKKDDGTTMSASDDGKGNKKFKVSEHGGRIVKGVNTTADVGTDEIKKQAAKFGNSVDKDGRPPTLSKKVKGKSTNVLFNLGLAEGNRQSNLIDFVNFCKDQLSLKSSPPIKFVSDTEDTTFGYFDNDTKGIVIQNTGRHQMDVMRTVAHELVHYKQDQTYDRELNGEDGSPDENQANALAGVILRRWGQKNPTLFTESVDADTQSSVYFTNMQEQLGEIASASEIYVDMDGVLADFFGEWTKLMNVDHWSKIDNNGLPGALQKIRDTDEFWLRLPILPQAKELLTLIKNIKGEYNICSSPLQDDPNSEPHKREWIKKNLSFFPPKNVYITHNKPQYAKNKDGTPNILIDDFGRNVKQWEDAGGIGFKYKDHKFERTAKQLQRHMTEPVKEAFDTEVDWGKDPEDQGDGEAYKATIGRKEVGIQYFFEPINAGGVIVPGLDITFEVNGTTKKTGGGDASTIFGAVINHIKQFIKQHSEIDAIQFSASKEQGLSRTRLYSAMVDKLSQGTGFINAKTISKADKSIKNADMFKLIKRDAIDRLNLDIGEPETESYTRDQMPQLTKKHLKTFPHKLEAIKLDKIIPVQQERLKENYIKQIKNIQKGNYNPIIVDSKNKIINGHHRYDVIKKIGMQEITVAKLPITLEQILEKLVNTDPKLPNLKEPQKPSKYTNRKTALSKQEPVTKEDFAEPQFDIEWEEANRYPFLDKLGKDGWIELAQTGKVANVNSNIVKKIGNTGADGSETLADLEPEKVQRLKKAMKSGTIEMPIVMKMPNGKLELIAGNTRLIGLISTEGKAKVWYIDASKLDENFADGKKKGKSKPGRVKQSGASCNGSVTSLRKKAKNASGERAKMYHWCANMKSGKKK